MIKKEEKEKLNKIREKLNEVREPLRRVALPAAVITGIYLGVKFEQWNDAGNGTGSFAIEKKSDGAISCANYWYRKFGRKECYVKATYEPDHPVYNAANKMYEIYNNEISEK